MKKNHGTLWLCALSAALFLLLSGCNTNLAAPPALDGEAGKVYISEIMSANKATLANDKGDFPDWLELHNGGDSPAELEGWVLTDGKERYTLPALTLRAGEYKVLFCAEGGGDEATVPFSLSKNGETLALERQNGKTADSVDIPPLDSDVSYARDKTGAFATTSYPSPGYENTEAGYIACQNHRDSGELIINEVMTYNQWYFPDDGNYYDWVELKNVSSESVDLKDYCLSDDEDDLQMYRLPDVTLAPGELYIVLCAGEDAPLVTGGAAPFALNSASETLYLARGAALSDYTVLRDIKYQGSYGRLKGQGGFFFFDYPTPKAENIGGARLISALPTVDKPQGIYDNVESITVQLSGAGPIYYTLDGSVPTTSSIHYTEPLKLSKTSVIRAICVEKGKLPGETLDLSYIINEEHSLPVVSLVTQREALFDWRTGIYAKPEQDWETSASVALFDGEEGFAINCGVKMHGATSRVAQDKKSMKLIFKDRYDGALSCDLFGNGVTDYSSVLLRAAQESKQTSHIRDILMHELAAQCSASLPVQSYKFCILYINGEYWGLYALREAHSEEHYAAHFGYDPATVTMTRGSWGQNSPLETAYNFARDHDASDSDSYAYLQQYLDMDNIITWQIIQSYSGNLDMNPPNVRFYYSSEDNIGRFALVDLDLALFTSGDFTLAYSMGEYTSYKYNALVKNLMFIDDYRAHTLELLSEYLRGPLSDENVLSELHSLTEEISPEIARDAERWDYDVDEWKMDLYYLEKRLTANGGMAKRFALSAQYSLRLSYYEWHDYFDEFS